LKEFTQALQDVKMNFAGLYRGAERVYDDIARVYRSAERVFVDIEKFDVDIT
jgi:hypothetical protein